VSAVAAISESTERPPALLAGAALVAWTAIGAAGAWRYFRWEPRS